MLRIKDVGSIFIRGGLSGEKKESEKLEGMWERRQEGGRKISVRRRHKMLSE